MSAVLVIVGLDAGDGDPAADTKSDAESMTFARQVAETVGGTLHAATIASGGPPPEGLTDAVASFGVTHLHQLVDPALSAYAPAAWAGALRAVIDAVEPVVIIGPGTDRGAEVTAHLAARLDLPLAANCIAMRVDEGAWSVTRLRWGGVLLEDARLDSPTAIVTVAAHQISASTVDGSEAPAVSTIEVEVDDVDLIGAVEETVTRGEGISLATADVVISGGRGVGGADGFAILEELADLLGGAVGCSRVATNNGWRSHNDQVGQTGTRVAPDLYVACGISGATQHWVGCMGAKRILAINTDAEAPMVTRADYAALGDLHEILPAVVAEVRRRQGG